MLHSQFCPFESVAAGAPTARNCCGTGKAGQSSGVAGELGTHRETCFLSETLREFRYGFTKSIRCRWTGILSLWTLEIT